MEPIPGGWHVKTLPDGRCVDVVRMLYNYRLLLSTPEHTTAEHGWCYFGHGRSSAGKPRTMTTAQLTAIAAAEVWDGAGEPPGYDKRAF